MNICSFTTQINLFKRNGRGSIRCGLPSTRIRNQSWQYSTSGHLPPYPSLHLSQIEQGPHAPQLANCSIVDVKVILQLSSALLLPNVIAIDVRLKWWLFHHELPFSALAGATGEMYSMTDARSAGHWRRIYNIHCRRMTLVWPFIQNVQTKYLKLLLLQGRIIFYSFYTLVAQQQFIAHIPSQSSDVQWLLKIYIYHSSEHVKGFYF